MQTFSVLTKPRPAEGFFEREGENGGRHPCPAVAALAVNAPFLLLPKV